MSLNLNAQQFLPVYEDLGIEIGELGCVMLDTDPLPERINDLIPEDDLYYSDNLKYVQGFVGAETPHVTLLFGLLPGVRKQHVDAVLDGWWTKHVLIYDVDYFESVYEGEEYYCIVASIDSGWRGPDSLLDAHRRLSFLPHINTFPTYSAHLTIAYIKKDFYLLHKTLDNLRPRLKGYYLDVKGLNYGDRIK